MILPTRTPRRDRRRRLALAICGLALTLAPGLRPALAGATRIAIAAQPAVLSLGGSTAVEGTIRAGASPLAGVALELQADAFPYRRPTILASALSGPDGSFAFTGLRLSRNTHLRVLAQPPLDASSAAIQVLVDPLATLSSASLGPGRVRLRLHLAHAAGLRSPPVAASWYLAPRGSGAFALATVTDTAELPGALTYATATVDPPARSFRYRVCLSPAWVAAMGPAGESGSCPGHGLRYTGEGAGRPLAPFPSAAAVAAAARFLAARAGRTSMAVVNSAGQLSGLNVGERFETASVVKVMFLTAYLQMLAARHRPLDAQDRSLLYPMIHESNNEDASAVLGIVGQAAVARVAREAGMSAYAPGVGWWAYSLTDAADQARLFSQLGRLVPPRFYGYARELMSTIEPSQSWGVPPVARPDWQVYFKTGALPSQGLFNEVALLERGGVSFTLAVFTDGDPSMEYGEQTIAGVAQRLLGG